MVVIKVRPEDTRTADGNHSGHSLSRSLIHLRYILVALCLLPASVVQDLRRPVRITLLSLYTVAMFLLLVSPVNIGLILFQSGPAQTSLADYVYKLIMYINASAVTLDNLCYLVISCFLKRFQQFDDQLANVERSFDNLRIPINKKLIRLIFLSMMMFSLFCIVLNIGLFVYDCIYHLVGIDPFGGSYRNSNVSLPVSTEILNVIWRMHMMQASVWWVFQPCHNTFMLVLIGILLNSFNSHLRKRLLSISCCNDTLYEDLELFRRARLELCALVDALDKLISVNMGISIATSTVTIVIVTYLVSVGLTPEDGNIRYMVLFWCVIYVVILFSAIAMCNVIKTKVRRIFRLRMREYVLTSIINMTNNLSL